MGTFSIWHWLIVIVFIAIPLVFLLRPAPTGPNRFGPPSSPKKFSEAIASFFKNYANFSGRASRSEFWYCILAILVVNIVIGLFDGATGDTGVISLVVSLAIIIPGLAVTTRRLHDINRSGWHQLLGWFGPIGVIGLIIWYCKPGVDTASQVAAGQYGRSATPPPLPNSRSHQTSGASQSKVETIERLAHLRDNGVLTQAEFELEKQKLLRT